MHEVEHDERRFGHRDCERYHGVQLKFVIAEAIGKVMKRSHDCQRGADQEHQENRNVNSNWNYMFTHRTNPGLSVLEMPAQQVQ